MLDLSKYKVHDLTHPLSEQMAGFSATTARTVDKDGWNAQTLTIYSHAGTHLDAPYHFAVSNKTIDDYAPTVFMGKAWMVRIQIEEQQQLLTVDDLGRTGGKVKPGDSLLLQTGWSKTLLQSYYRDGLPRISRELAQWCVDKKIKILGVEPQSVADVNNLAEVTEIHQILLGGNVIIVEGLTNLDQIQSEAVFLIALPLKIKGGDGAPARVIALETIELK